jgi:omega-amidase
MENLKVTLVQSDIVWENVEANLKKYENMLEGLESTDLIILPEMCTTGFSMEIEKLKEPMNGPSIGWMKQLARQKNASVAGSLIIEDAGKVYNRAVWVSPEGAVSTYDKRHLYTMGQENEHYTAGKSKTIIEFRGWKFCPLICYDLRFPVWARNAEDYDVLFFMANWPTPRHHVWKNLLIARSIENQCYCFGVNRLGTDGAGLNYIGDSGYVSPRGFADFMAEKEGIRTFEISYSELHSFRKSFPLLSDRDTFEVKL